MYIADYLYTINSNSLEIYLNGCKPKLIKGKYQHCPGCHNSELFDFKDADNIEDYLNKIDVNLTMFDSMVKYIFILGGEPMDQDRTEMENMINRLKKYNKELVIFTGYDLEYYKANSYDVDYVKTGYYDAKSKKTKFNKTLNLELIGRNQKVYDKSYNEVL